MSIESMNVSGAVGSLNAQQQASSQNRAVVDTSPAGTGAVAEQAAVQEREQAQQVGDDLAAEQSQDDLAEMLESQLEKLNTLMQDKNRSIQFSVDRDLDEVVVKVVDTQTEEVIRQIPNEETLKFAKNLEGVLGVIFNERA